MTSLPICKSDAPETPPPGISDGALVVDDLTISHGGVPALKNLSCRISCGSLLALMGPNGGGKSSFLRTLAGFHDEHYGRWGWLGGGGQENPPLRKLEKACIAYLPQNHGVHSHFPLTVQQVVAMGRWRFRFLPGAGSRKDTDCVHQALTLVDLLSQKDRPISHLSGGQFQRMLFARMAAQEASLFFLDEPFSAMDEATTELLLSVTARWSQEGKTLVVAQHDHGRALKYFPHTLLVARDFHRFGVSSQVLTRHNWAHAYEAMGPT